MAFIKNGPGIERKITASISDAAVLREICMRQRKSASSTKQGKYPN
jgi:hypothetical protein